MITVESNMEYEESRGHKGELRSLSSLRNLLGGLPKEPPAAETPPTPETGQAASETDQAQATDE